MATARRSTDVDVVVFGDGNRKVGGSLGASDLAGVSKVVGLVGSVGHATFGHTAIAPHFDPKRHQCVVMFTDDQQHDSGRVRLDHVPVIYSLDVAGDRPSVLPAAQRGRYAIGGFSDATFTVMDVLRTARGALAVRRPGVSRSGSSVARS